MDRGAWWAVVHGVSRKSDMTEVTQHECKAHSRYYIKCFINILYLIMIMTFV